MKQSQRMTIICPSVVLLHILPHWVATRGKKEISIMPIPYFILAFIVVLIVVIVIERHRARPRPTEEGKKEFELLPTLQQSVEELLNDMFQKTNNGKAMPYSFALPLKLTQTLSGKEEQDRFMEEMNRQLAPRRLDAHLFEKKDVPPIRFITVARIHRDAEPQFAVIKR